MKASYTVSKNVFFLGSVQAFNYLVPIVVIPILLDRIGLERYGLVSLAQGIMFLIVPITDFGLNLTGTRLTSQSTGKAEIQENVSKIIFGKLVLLVPCFLILLFLSSTITKWKENQDLLLLSYILVVGNSLFPMWYFVGTQKTGILSLLNLISRLIYLVAILVLIKGPDDFYLVNVFSGVGWITASVIGLYIIRRDLSIHILKMRLNLKDIVSLTKLNTSIFLSSFMSSTYRSGGIVIAGFFLTSTPLGIYGVLDKVLNLVVNSFIVLYNAVFPRVCFLAMRSKKLVTSFYRKLFPRIGSIVIVASALMAILGSQILSSFIDEISFIVIENYMYLVALFPLMVFLNLPFSLTFVSFDFKREYFIYNATSLTSFALAGWFLCSKFGISGILYGILGTEALLFLVGIYLTKSKGINVL